MKHRALYSRPLAATTAALAVILGSTAASRAALTVTTGLELHFDAGSITPVADGANVSSWTDSSGNGRNLGETSSTTDTTPTYLNAAIGGLPAVRFSGGGLVSSFPTNLFTGGTNTIFTVFRSTTVTTSDGTLVSLNGNSVNQAFQYLNRYREGDLFATYDGSSGDNGDSQNLDGPYNDGGGHLFTSYSGTDTVFQRADGGTASLSYTDGILATDIDGVTLGVLNDGSGAMLSGDIAEVLVYSRILTPSEIASVESHLLGKYSLVPEPSAALLSALGLGFALSRRRR